MPRISSFYGITIAMFYDEIIIGGDLIFMRAMEMRRLRSIYGTSR
jgi:hypothetical protein